MAMREQLQIAQPGGVPIFLGELGRAFVDLAQQVLWNRPRSAAPASVRQR